jgi:hypothetical protein
MATVSPRLEGLVLFGHRAFLTFDERLEFTAYVDHSDQNYWDQRGNARIVAPWRRMGFFSDLVLNRVRERPVDLQDIRPTRRERGLGGGVILLPGWRTELEMGVTRTRWAYSDPDFLADGQTIDERLDRDQDRLSLRARYRLVGRTYLTSDAYLGRFEFAEPDPDGGSKDSRERTLLPGVDFGEGGRLSGTARLGWTEIDTEDSQRPDFSDVVGNIALAYRPGSHTTLRADAMRQPGFTVTGSTLYYLESRAGVGAVRYFNRIVGIEANVARTRLTFPDTSDDRTDRILQYDGAVRLRLAENSLGRRVEYRLRLERYVRDSTLDSEDLSRTTFGVGAVVGF